MANFFGITLDEHLHMEGKNPAEVSIIEKVTSKSLKLIQQLIEEDKNDIFRIIKTILTKAKFKEFFKKM